MEEIFNDLKERLDNCAFDEDDSIDMAIKDKFSMMLYVAQKQMEARSEMIFNLTMMISACLAGGRAGLINLANDEENKASKFVKENLDALLETKKIEILINENYAQINLLDEDTNNEK